MILSPFTWVRINYYRQGGCLLVCNQSVRRLPVNVQNKLTKKEFPFWNSEIRTFCWWSRKVGDTKGETKILTSENSGNRKKRKLCLNNTGPLYYTYTFVVRFVDDWIPSCISFLWSLLGYDPQFSIWGGFHTYIDSTKSTFFLYPRVINSQIDINTQINLKNIAFLWPGTLMGTDEQGALHGVHNQVLVQVVTLTNIYV